jgi:hypothetical protein
MGIARVGLIVTATALVLAGCVSRDGTAEQVLAVPEPARAGDQLDPCSLTGPAAFEPVGNARMPGKPMMDECRVSVATEDGRVGIRVGQQVPVDQLSGDFEVLEDLGGGVTIQRIGQGCVTALVLDRYGIAVTATDELGDAGPVPGKDVVCELVEGAVRGVYNVFLHERAEFWTPEPASFALLDACELLPAESVFGELGVNGQTEPSPTGHSCSWHGPEDSANLWFPVAESPNDAGVPKDTPTEQLGGRDSWVVNNASDCTVYTQHIEFEPGVGTFEFASLTVSANDDPCSKARAIADEAWAALPT